MTIIDMAVICVMAIAAMTVFDFVSYTLKPAPCQAHWNKRSWFAGAILLALGIGYFALGGVAL